MNFMWTRSSISNYLKKNDALSVKLMNSYLIFNIFLLWTTRYSQQSATSSQSLSIWEYFPRDCLSMYHQNWDFICGYWEQMINVKMWNYFFNIQFLPSRREEKISFFQKNFCEKLSSDIEICVDNTRKLENFIENSCSSFRDPRLISLKFDIQID